MSRELENLISKLFIARKDVKAIQHKNGAWSPHQEYNSASGRHDGPRIPWRRDDLEAHLSGRNTFGHYLLDAEGKCKLFAFDIDLKKTGLIPRTDPFLHEGDDLIEYDQCDDLRAEWSNRASVARNFFKYEFKTLAHQLLVGVSKVLELPGAVAYSGAKGVHVYAFTDLIPAEEARRGARIIIDTVGLKPGAQPNFFEHDDYPNLSIELFPKQDNLDGKVLGNLMRLPLGRNQKSSDPTFFVDMNSPLAQMVPIDPVEALMKGNPWE